MKWRSRSGERMITYPCPRNHQREWFAWWGGPAIDREPSAPFAATLTTLHCGNRWRRWWPADCPNIDPVLCTCSTTRKVTSTVVRACKCSKKKEKERKEKGLRKKKVRSIEGTWRDLGKWKVVSLETCQKLNIYTVNFNSATLPTREIQFQIEKLFIRRIH